MHRREIGDCIIRGSGIWAMDLMGTGWLLDNGIWENISALTDIYAKYIGAQTRQSRFDMVFVVDEAAESIECTAPRGRAKKP